MNIFDNIMFEQAGKQLQTARKICVNEIAAPHQYVQQKVPSTFAQLFQPKAQEPLPSFSVSQVQAKYKFQPQIFQQGAYDCIQIDPTNGVRINTPIRYDNKNYSFIFLLIFVNFVTLWLLAEGLLLKQTIKVQNFITLFFIYPLNLILGFYYLINNYRRFQTTGKFIKNFDDYKTRKGAFKFLQVSEARIGQKNQYLNQSYENTFEISQLQKISDISGQLCKKFKFKATITQIFIHQQYEHADELSVKRINNKFNMFKQTHRVKQAIKLFQIENIDQYITYFNNWFSLLMHGFLLYVSNFSCLNGLFYLYLQFVTSKYGLSIRKRVQVR